MKSKRYSNNNFQVTQSLLTKSFRFKNRGSVMNTSKDAMPTYNFTLNNTQIVTNQVNLLSTSFLYSRTNV